MIYAFDTEFNDTGTDFELISIGIVAANGREYYAQDPNFNWGSNVDKDKFWLRENVKPGLKSCGNGLSDDHVRWELTGRPCSYLDCPWRGPKRMAQEVAVFTQYDNTPEFWGFFVSWDWIILCRLYGRVLFDIPGVWPNRANDIAQLASDHNLNIQRDSSYTHNSLDDARWTMREYQRLQIATANIRSWNEIRARSKAEVIEDEAWSLLNSGKATVNKLGQVVPIDKAK